MLRWNGVILPRVDHVFVVGSANHDVHHIPHDLHQVLSGNTLLGAITVFGPFTLISFEKLWGNKLFDGFNNKVQAQD